MFTAPVRQQAAFPTVARIHKGTPKKKIKRGEKFIEVFGDDLNDRFRVHFLAGTQESKQIFHNLHEKEHKQYPENYTIRDGYEVKALRAMIPARSVWDNWKWENVAFDHAGRKIALADHDHYITKKDPLTDEFLIQHGEPYEKFQIGDVIEYEREGRKFVLPIKSRGILKLFLPELVKGVTFELITNSPIDCLNIERHLGAIQNIADVMNGGVAGGIPLDIYRVEQDCPWFDDRDHTAKKGKKWFIQIEANREWMKAAIERMQKYALTGEAVTGLLQPLAPLDLSALPQTAFTEDDDDPDEYVKTENIEVIEVEEQSVIRNQNKRETEKPKGVIGWLMDVHKVDNVSHAANIANLLKLTNPKLTSEDWERRYSKYLNLKADGKESQDAAKITLEGEQ